MSGSHAPGAVPETPMAAADSEAVAAAVRIFGRIPYASEHDDILRRAAEAFPAKAYPDVLARVVLLNDLYGTNLMAVGRMAAHICSIPFGELPSDSWVDAIADLPDDTGEVPRRMVSFASKYAHFFIDGRRFHISDEAARVVLARHAGDTRQNALSWTYGQFNERAEKLRNLSGLPEDRTLDRYLWVAGMYLRSQRPKSGGRINRNLATAFDAADSCGDLRILMSSVPLRRRARGGPLRRIS